MNYKKITLVSLILSLFLLTGCSPEDPQEQNAKTMQMHGMDMKSSANKVVYTLPTQYQWKLGRRYLEGAANTYVFVLQNESTTHWTQIITEAFYRDTKLIKWDPEESTDQLRNYVNNTCKVISFSKTQKNSNDITLTMMLNTCTGFDAPNQYLVYRIWRDVNGIYTLTYQATPEVLSDSLKATMRSTVANASLQKGTAS